MFACGQVSTVLGAVIPTQRAEQAWTEGVAIWVAVIVVSFVGALPPPPQTPSTVEQLCDMHYGRLSTAATGMCYCVRLSAHLYVSEKRARRVRTASGNDFQKDQQFRKLNKQKDTIEVKAVRGGHECLVTNTDVVVGDILLLDTGDKLVADGVAVEAFGLVIDEVWPAAHD